MMKQQIRLGVFETNSSSVHSLTMVEKPDYEKWKKGEILFSEYGCNGDSEFLPADEAIEKNLSMFDKEDLTEKFVEEYRKTKNLYRSLDVDEDCGIDYDDLDLSELYLNYEEYEEMVAERYCYEEFEEEYKTKSGETIVAFGYYGHD